MDVLNILRVYRSETWLTVYWALYIRKHSGAAAIGKSEPPKRKIEGQTDYAMPERSDQVINCICVVVLLEFQRKLFAK